LRRAVDVTTAGSLPDDTGLYERPTGRDVVDNFAGHRRRPADVDVIVTLADRF